MSVDSLSFSADPNQIPVVYDFVDQLLTQRAIAKELADRIRLAVIEATTNAILHGSQSDPKNTIVLRINWEDQSGCYRFSVKDQGNGFAVDKLPDPTAPKRLQMESGRGVYIMKQLADRIEFLQGGSEVVLIFNS
jgi:serine/threonine-protein kinase RsbW